jgi:hypothetical protein
MEKEFVTYELALRMKQVGFDEPCLSVYISAEKLRVPTKFSIVNNILNGEYNDDFIPVIKCVAPTWQQAFRWFRDNYNVHSSPVKFDETKWWVNWGNWTSPVFEIFEEAEKCWLEKLLEIAETLQNEKRN